MFSPPSTTNIRNCGHDRSSLVPEGHLVFDSKSGTDHIEICEARLHLGITLLEGGIFRHLNASLNATNITWSSKTRETSSTSACGKHGKTSETGCTGRGSITTFVYLQFFASQQLIVAGTSTPLVPDLSDDEMADAPPSDVATPRDEEDDGNGDQEDAEPEELDDRPITPNRDSETPSRSGTPRRSGRSTSLLPRKRRLGRPPKSRQAGSDEERNDVPSDTGTPRRRGGFRGHRGGRWAKRGGGPSHVTQVPIDKEGNMMDVVDDEVDTPADPEGEKKVDKFGYLQDGREYRVRTFTILGRGRRLYMLSTEPARCIGFRDSYLFFQKHRLLYKIIIDDEEKRDLIERDLIPHSYKGRAIGVVTARSVFREFGAKIIIGGKKVVDDYAVQEARARGDVEGELAVPDDRLPLPGEPYNRNQYVAWHGASAVYHSGVPSVPLPSGKIIDGKKRKVAVTSDNWMLEHARAAR